MKQLAHQNFLNVLGAVNTGLTFSSPNTLKAKVIVKVIRSTPESDYGPMFTVRNDLFSSATEAQTSQVPSTRTSLETCP